MCILFLSSHQRLSSYLPTSTLNAKYICAVLIKLHDSATYDVRGGSGGGAPGAPRAPLKLEKNIIFWV